MPWVRGKTLKGIRVIGAGVENDARYGNQIIGGARATKHHLHELEGLRNTRFGVIRILADARGADSLAVTVIE